MLPDVSDLTSIFLLWIVWPCNSIDWSIKLEVNTFVSTENVKSSLEIIAVKNVSEVLKIALTEAPVPVEWDEAAEEAAAAKALKNQNDSQTTKH